MEPAEVQQAMTETLSPVYDHAAVQEAGVNIEKEMPLLTLTQQLFQLFSSNHEELKQVQAEYQQLQDRITSLTENLKTRQEEYQSTVKQLRQRVEELAAKNEENRQEWQEEMTRLEEQLAQATQETDQRVSELQQQLEKKEEQLAEARQQVRDLQETMASFRPRGDTYAAIRVADGSVVQVPAGEDIVYISLGERDGIQPGLTFEVYSRREKIPASGEGKASIRVSHVYETTSAAKIIQKTPTEPILEQDVIANPIFAKDRKYNFLVAGDFDLDFDGEIDDPGGDRVERMIRKAGGNIVEKVTTATDFVVLGSAPPAPKELPEGTEDQAAVEKQEELEAERQAFKNILQKAQSLGVPILTRTQFLHYAGVGVPENVEQDKRPIMAQQ
jgi:hypothetical protein